MQHGSSKDKGEKITCNHLTFAPCKGPREPAIASAFRYENAVCPLFLARQREFSGQKSALGHHRCCRGFARAQHRGTGAPGGLGAGEGDVVRRGEQPAAPCLLWLGAGCCSRSSLHLPEGVQVRPRKGAKMCPGLIACPRLSFFFFPQGSLLQRQSLIPGTGRAQRLASHPRLLG